MRNDSSRQMLLSIAVCSSVLLGAIACKGSEKPVAPSAAAPSAQGVATPAPGGKVIVVQATTDDKGSFFTPSEITAKAGDVLRFTLVQGVHNVNFLPDSNPGISNLPPISDFMQLPGQTIDIVVPDAKGKKLFFQCDPHVLLGMKGHITVEN